jgi:site-specific recombinase XerD
MSSTAPRERAAVSEKQSLSPICVLTRVLENNADIAKIQEWLGHANVSTTRLYDSRKTRLEESPYIRVKY